MAKRTAAEERELFDRLIAMTRSDREQYLDEHCDEPEVRATVERLLAADDAASSANFLLAEQPDQPRTVSDLLESTHAALAKDPLLGQRIGRFHIKSLIGAGGMAHVYEAVQEEPHRVVALKVMKPNLTARTSLRRFRYEAQVLGRLRHPNIAQIFDAGTAIVRTHAAAPDAEVPYFAMEYLPGARPITTYAIEKEVPPRVRLKLLAKICDAVHHGHQRGVIHRDLKPANLLVDWQGEPKVIDFGVARGTDSDIAMTIDQTHLGELVGTMQYMSPEQCDADPYEIDTRSDVYSLGIVLFELLTDALPYSVADMTIFRATQAIKLTEAKRPFAGSKPTPGVSKRLRRDLDAITLKALAKDPAKRYASAEALADDIRSALGGTPVRARTASVWARMTNWVASHPIATSISLSFCASLLIVSGAVFVGWVWGKELGKVRVSDSGDELLLFDRAGMPVRLYSGAGPSLRTFAYAAVLDRPDGSPRRALVVGTTTIGTDEFAPGLHVRDTARPDETVRVLEVPQHLIPDSLVRRTDYKFTSASFGVACAYLADVFTELPGEEVVVAFQHSNTTHTMLAIFDAAWEQRYAVWIDADIDAFCWMPGAGQLVCVGANGSHTFQERGIQPTDVRTHPNVVFALRPVRDFVRNQYVEQEQAAPKGTPPELRPAWYWMLPHWTTFSAIRLGPPLDRSGDGAVRLEVGVRNASGDAMYSVSWVLDDRGAGGDHPIFPDLYAQFLSGKRTGFENQIVPPPEHWVLRDLPSPIAARATASAPTSQP
ncbi:MAG: serine/threonine-protein kinase [Planctomycetota bacterium]